MVIQRGHEQGKRHLQLSTQTLTEKVSGAVTGLVRASIGKLHPE